MINRELIRLKTVQLVYAYYENEGKTVENAEKEFLFSLQKAHELYYTLLLLMVSINHIARRTVEMQQNRARRLNEGEISTRFIDNLFINQLRDNEQLRKFQDSENVAWAEDDEMLRRIYIKITEQDFYKAYMKEEHHSYEDDRELWRKIYRHLLTDNEEIDALLEERSIYWNDDKTIVDTFVLKTIRHFEEEKGAQQKLLPDFKDNDDLEYAKKLFRTSIKNKEWAKKLIAEQTKNWDVDRIALMDLVILQVALTEIATFPEIPLNVSINEYVEIAKAYSTPQSGKYVNGMLDTIGKRLISEGLIEKN